MTNFFDGARFARLWCAHWAESWREYAWFFGVAAMVDLIFAMIFLSTNNEGSFREFQFDGQIAWYTIGLYVTAIIFAGRYFKHLTDPGSALTALMRPGSLFEKWLLTVIFVSVLFPLAYTAFYSLLNYPIVQLAHAMNAAAARACSSCSVSPPPDFSFYVPLLTASVKTAGAEAANTFLRMQFLFLLVLWSLQAVVLGGTAYFKKSPVLRTVLSLFLIFVMMAWIGAAPQMGAFWSLDDELVPYTTLETALSLAEWVGLPVLLWIVVFFHLKEREVS